MITNNPVSIRVHSWMNARLPGALDGWLGSLADFVFPPYCACCRQRMPRGEREPICGSCWEQAELWGQGACQRCGAGLGPADSPRLCPACRIDDWPCADVRAPGPFAGTVAEAIHLLKYSERPGIARRLA